METAFANYRLNSQTRELTSNGEPIAVEPQVFEVIEYLIQHRDRIVSKDELVSAVWDGRVVSDTAITSRINSARRALGDDGKSQQVIRTYPRRGFRFVAQVASQNHSNDPLSVERIAERPAIAVLPFANLSGQSEDEFIGDGICEDLTTALSSVRMYRVISRNSTAKYKGHKPELSELAEQLGVSFVISGSFRRSGARLRIGVQLDDVRSAVQIWAKRFERDYSDLFEIQDQVVAALIGQLEPELDQAGFRRVGTTPSNRLSAWELYQKAMVLVAERRAETTLEARALFQQAIALEPSFSRAHAALTQTFAHIAVTTGDYLDGTEMLEAARQAVVSDSRDYWSQTALGIAFMFCRDLPGSLGAHERAIELNPHNAQTRAWYAIALCSSGRAQDAIPQLELAIRLSPGDPWIGPFYGRLSRAHYYLGQIEAAMAAAEKAFNYAHVWPVHACYTACLARLDRTDEMRRAYGKLRAKQPGIDQAFVRKHLPEWHKPYIDTLIADLEKAGLP